MIATTTLLDCSATLALALACVGTLVLVVRALHAHV